MVSYEFSLFYTVYTVLLGIAMFTIIRISFNYTDKKYNKLYENIIDKHLFVVEHMNKLQDQIIHITEEVKPLYKYNTEFYDKEEDVDSSIEEETIEEINNESSYKHYIRLINANEIYIGNTDNDLMHDPEITKLIEIRNYLCAKKRTNTNVRCVLVFSDQVTRVDIDMYEVIDMLSAAIIRKGRGNQFIIQGENIYTISTNDYRLVDTNPGDTTEKVLRINCKKSNNNSITIIPLTLTEYIKIPNQYYYEFK